MKNSKKQDLKEKIFYNSSKKKELLQEWEDLKLGYLEKITFKELYREYLDWFADEPSNYDFTQLEEETNNPKRKRFRKDMINALIESEREYRLDDNVEALVEEIRFIKVFVKKKFRTEEWLNNFADYVLDLNFDLYEEARDYANGIETKNK